MSESLKVSKSTDVHISRKKLRKLRFHPLRVRLRLPLWLRAKVKVITYLFSEAPIFM